MPLREEVVVPVDERSAFATIRELADQIRRKRISPVELTDMFLKRIEKYDPKLTSFITVMPDQARRDAQQAETEIRAGKYRGLLHGIPWGVKDICSAKGVRTTWGSPIFKDQVFDYDSTVVARLRDAGAVLLGKLATGEFAGGARHLGGQVHNPWKLDRTPSGSSCGPGAATAGGLVTFSIGSETSGSIMGPSGSNGLSGLVPTYGRVSRHGAMALCWSLDKLGPMCHSADDVAIVLSAISGPDPNDVTAQNAPFPYANPFKGNVRGKRLGVVRAEFQPAETAGTKQIFDDALKTMQDAGCQLEDVEIREFPWAEVIGITINVESAATFEDLVRDGRFDDFAVKTRGNSWAAGLTVSAVDYVKAQRIRSEMIRYARSLFEKYDALIAPNNTSPAAVITDPNTTPPGPPPNPPGTPPRYLSNLCNLTGVPFFSTRCGFKDNLPLGLRFVGPHLGEATILELAHAYETATRWKEKVPEYTE